MGLEEQRLAKKKSREDIEAEGMGSVKAFSVKTIMHLWGDVCLGCGISMGSQAMKGSECEAEKLSWTPKAMGSHGRFKRGKQKTDKV